MHIKHFWSFWYGYVGSPISSVSAQSSVFLPVEDSYVSMYVYICICICSHSYHHSFSVFPPLVLLDKYGAPALMFCISYLLKHFLSLSCLYSMCCEYLCLSLPSFLLNCKNSATFTLILNNSVSLKTFIASGTYILEGCKIFFFNICKETNWKSLKVLLFPIETLFQLRLSVLFVYLFFSIVIYSQMSEYICLFMKMKF